MGLARTPIGKFGGAMSAVSGPRLGAIAVREAVARSGALGPPLRLSVNNPEEREHAF